MTKFKVGDQVVRVCNPSGLLDKGSKRVVVAAEGDAIQVKEGWFLDCNFDLDTDDDPPAAEVGTYYVALLNPKNNGYAPQHSQHDYWVDAEAEAEKMAETFPGATFAVLKLVGSVHTSIVWS